MESVCIRKMHSFRTFQRYGEWANSELYLFKLGNVFFYECWDFILCNFEYFLFKVNYGSRNTNSNSAVHLHMLQESHMIIRNALIGQHTKDEHLLDLYRESCGLLGEYYSKWVNNYFKIFEYTGKYKILCCWLLFKLFKIYFCWLCKNSWGCNVKDKLMIYRTK